MPDHFDIAHAFTSRQAELLAALGNKPPAHSGSVGTDTELKWRDMLRAFLPSRYEVGNGFAVSVDGECSDQIDILIYDRQYTPVLWRNADLVTVPAESVYGVFEIKPSMNKANVDYAAEKLESVRKLRRTSAEITSNMGVTAPREPKPILGGLLAAGSDWTPFLGDPLFNALSSRVGTSGRLDLGCALNAGAWSIPGDWESAQFRSGDHSLIFFAMKLFELLRPLGTVTAIDISAWLETAGVGAEEVDLPPSANAAHRQ